MKSITVTDPSQQLFLDFGDQNCMISEPLYEAISSGPILTTGCDIDWSLIPSINLNDTLTISNLDDKLGPSLGTVTGAKISLQGDDADIEINGESIVEMLREIRDRLNIIQVSETMESEWDELRTLREQYEAKLAECREKSEAWNALKQISAPQER